MSNENLKKLNTALEEWLMRNNLDGGTKFYSIEEWRLRNEEYLNESELVLVFDGTLCTLLNYGGDTEEFENLVESFGYYFEQGHSWNMGFYHIPNYDFSKPNYSYGQKLRDNRWTEKRDFIRKRAGGKCEDCGSDKRLEIHHCYYIKEHEPWEYPYDALRCLCHACHESRPRSEIRMRAFMAKLTQTQMDSLREGLDTAFYWFEPKAVLDLLLHLRPPDEEILDRVQFLLQCKTDQE